VLNVNCLGFVLEHLWHFSIYVLKICIFLALFTLSAWYPCTLSSLCMKMAWIRVFYSYEYGKKIENLYLKLEYTKLSKAFFCYFLSMTEICVILMRLQIYSWNTNNCKLYRVRWVKMHINIYYWDCWVRQRSVLLKKFWRLKGGTWNELHGFVIYFALKCVSYYFAVNAVDIALNISTYFNAKFCGVVFPRKSLMANHLHMLWCGVHCGTRLHIWNPGYRRNVEKCSWPGSEYFFLL
jgi:hypothetical protein